MTSNVSEYQEAKKRFKKLTKEGMHQKSDNDSYANNCNLLDNIISEICRGDACVDLGNNSSLFYEIIFYSDFIQMKHQVAQKFYSELCRIFISSGIIDDTIKNLKKLEDIPHVKANIAQAFFQEFQVSSTFRNNSLVLGYSKEIIWHNISSSKVDNIIIQPCAYKVMFSSEKFKVCHLHFILLLFDVKEVNLVGCNLNKRNMENLFEGLQLQALKLSSCGSSINQIIWKNIYTLKNLTFLDISNNPLFDETLKKIRCIPLKSLNISNCIKHSGKFIDSIWFANSFSSKKEEKKMIVNIDLLWSEGPLRQTIEILNVSYNSMSLRNLQEISKLQLKELDITSSFEIDTFSTSDFPTSLRILKAKKNKVDYNKFKALCGIQLEKLEVDYCGTDDDDIQICLNHTPLTNTLKELSVSVVEPSEHFLSFISQFKLKRFECEVETCDYFSIDPFFLNNPEEREYLETLKIGGPGLDMTDKFIMAIKNLQLKELTISLPDSDHKFWEILSCENIQKTVVNLDLLDKDVENDDLKQVVKFKKLEGLSFSYSNDIDIAILSTIVEMTTIKDLELEAVVKGELNETLAHALCIAPVKKLTIYDDYGKSICDEAFKYLSMSENLLKFSKYLIHLHMRAVIKPNMATILSSASWQSIVLEHSVVKDHSLKLMFDNEELVFTLDHLKIFDLDDENLDWESIAKLNLSKLEIEQHEISGTVLPILCKGPITTFLRFLFLEAYNQDANKIDVDPLLQTSVSEVDTYVYQ